MRRILHNLYVQCRRALVQLCLLVPAPLRARLSRNPWLSRIYVYFDDARYEPVLDEAAFADWVKDGRPLLNAMPLHAYRHVVPAFTKAEREWLDRLEPQPLISVLMPVYNAPPEWLSRALDSLSGQWYEHWELCLVDDCSSAPATVQFIAALDHPRVKVRRLPVNRHIAAASNAALEMAEGEYVALLDHDDELSPDALFRVVQCIAEHAPDLVYSDEDKLDPQGRFVEPHFKPAYAPDTLLSQNYISHLAVIRRELAVAVGGFTEGLEGAQDYDLYLKVLEHARQVVHLPRVLYHWRQSAGSTAAQFAGKSWAQAAGRRALEAAVARRGLNACVEDGLHEGTYRVRHAISGQPLVSIIVPFRDRADLLSQCFGAILERSSYANFELIGIDNGSVELETAAAMQALAERDPRVRFHAWNAPFNFSALNNHAVHELARGEHVVLLNNDIEIMTPDWIECLLEHSQRPAVGAVGAKLYYPGGRIQHAGIMLGIGGLAGHSHKYIEGDSPGYFARLRIVQNVSAVTAACLMVKKDLYLTAGGLDERNLAIAFNDVDFCLRLRERGLVNVFTPYCEAVHHESLSRGAEDTPEKRARFSGEVEFAMCRHKEALAKGDPYYNPNLTLDREDFSLKSVVEDFLLSPRTGTGS